MRYDSESAKVAEKKSHTPEANAKRNATRTRNAEIRRLVEGDVLSYIRAALTMPDKNGHVFYEDFIKKYLEQAKADVESKPAQLLASNLFQSDILKKLDAETDKVIARDTSFSRYRLSQTVFAKQLEILNDRQNKQIVIICGRRSGKTEGNARKLVDACLDPNTPTCYIHLTFTNGIAQCFDLCVKAAEEINFPIKKADKTEGLIEFTNGSTIRFRGNANKQESEKVRGFKYKLVIIDECQSQRNLRYLVEDVIEPLQLDFEKHQLLLTGTPPRVPHTFFENAYKGHEYKPYHWDMRDNPFIPNAQEAIEEICRKKGLTMDSTLIQREYLGQIVYDTDALIFRGYKEYENEVPEDFKPNRCYIGVDFGFSDYNAIITMACDTETKRAFIVRESKFNMASVTKIVEDVGKALEHAKGFIVQRNRDVDLNGAVTIYCDTNEQSIAYEINQTYNMPCYNAYKYDRDMAIEQLAEWHRTGVIQVPKGGILADEFEQIVHPRDTETDAIMPGIDDDVFHPDATMAELYASRQFAYEIGDPIGGKSSEVGQ